ncbi:hypothetical protein A0H81_04880 [Grifola frondosa]|uniref:Uncharacterized protein n=1 Tax=Grifola frondosa TaxID=5627 RepID=A0A1C7MF57_GRIFR|nr:hypothetical protein A0H81_04880 [Grifola frondosa]
MSSNPAFARFLALARRAGVDSLDAAPPPVAGQKQMVPEIGGSSGGFIALVVTLAAILLFSCVAIFFLLRNHSPTPYERQLRRARSLRHDYSSEAPVGPIGLRDRIAQFFGRRRHAGWIRASGGEGDEWEASDDIPVHRQVEELREGTRSRDLTPKNHEERLLRA